METSYEVIFVRKKLCSLQRIQNRIFHLIESVTIKNQIPSERLSAENTITNDWAIIVHRILKKKCPKNVNGKFTRRPQISKYEVRRINYLEMPKPRLALSKRFFARRCKDLE